HRLPPSGIVAGNKVAVRNFCHHVYRSEHVTAILVAGICFCSSLSEVSGLRWVPTGKIFKSSTTVVDSEPPNGSNADITNQYECEQTLNVNACTLNLSEVKMEILLEPTSNKLSVESDSLPHAHAQITKTYYKHQDSRIKKAQVLKAKTSANFDIKDPSSKTKLQGRFLASFQDDAEYEHVGQDTRSQGGKNDQDKQGKDLGISDVKTKSKDNDKGSRSKITQHEGTSLQQDKDQDNDKSLTTKAISLIL
nr:hypothetical protein [Tanacetum cinerariifolium]